VNPPGHLDDERLSRLIDGALEPAVLAETQRHLESCAECRARFESVVADERALRSMLTHDPGEAYFSDFAGRVNDRLRLSGARPAVPVREPGIFTRVMTFLLSSEGLAWSGVAATIVVGAGIVMLVGRETPLSTLRDNRVDQRVQQAPAPQAKTFDQNAPQEEKQSADERAADKNENFAESPVVERVKVGERDALRRDVAGNAAPSAQATRQEADSKLEASSGASSTTSSLAKENVPSAPEPARAREVKRGAGEDYPAPQKKSMPSPPASTMNQTAPSGGMKSRVRTQAPLSTSQEGAADEVASLEAKDLGGQICGTVRDWNGRPLSGAQVVVADLGVTAVTGADGSYCVPASPGTHQVSVLALGFQTVRSDVEVKDTVRDHDVKLDAVIVLDEGMKKQVAKGFSAPPPFTWPEAARASATTANGLTAEAIKTMRATAYDSAAAAWEEVTRHTGSGFAQVEARRRLYEQRVLAYGRGGDAKRKQAAIDALKSYLAIAPPGSDRDRAQKTLNSLQ
jgi:hypothetical protein